MFLSSSAPGAAGYISSSPELRAYAGLARPILCRAATQSEPLTHTRSHPSLPGPFSCSPCTRSPHSQPCSLCSAEGPTGFAGPSPSRLLPTPASIPFREGSKMPAPLGCRACCSTAGTPFPAPLRLNLEVASLGRPSPLLTLNEDRPPVTFSPRSRSFHFRAAGTRCRFVFVCTLICLMTARRLAQCPHRASAPLTF